MDGILIEIARITSNTIYIIDNFLSMEESNVQKRSKSKTLSVKNIEDEQLDDYISDDEDGLNTEEAMDFTDLSLTDSDLDEVKREWLRHSLIVGGVNMDMLVIAFSQKFVILERSTKSDSSTMDITAKVRIINQGPVYITALMVFGVAPSTSSLTSRSLMVDWNCICVGLNTGDLHFYTQQGVLIFMEHCTNSPIKALKIGSSVLPGNQELVIMTGDAKFIVVEGLSLFTTLRSARSQIAQGRSVEEISSILQMNGHQLLIEKFRHISDVQMTGIPKFSAFDHYLNAFYAGRRNEPVTRSDLPLYTQYLCFPACEKKISADSKELVAFLWHDNLTPSSDLLKEALFSLTSQISNNIPSLGIRSFLGVGTSRKDRPIKQMLSQSRSHWIYIKSSLRDGKRLADRTFLAPNGWNLVAVADNMGRVLLVNTNTRRILRVWKGYRHARCSWIEEECAKDDKNKKLLFLVIYAPKRGIIEVWQIENGLRISAFIIKEHGRLISIPSVQSGILQCSEGNGYTKKNSSMALFLSSDGSLFSWNIGLLLDSFAEKNFETTQKYL